MAAQYILAALAIKLDSSGPVFFRQHRIGTGGRPFRVWKFRTMQNGSSDAVHRDLVTRMLIGEELGTAQTGADGKPVYKLVNDSRVTRVGKFLRRTSIDELPQLFNVLSGDMSLLTYRQMCELDVQYVRDWSLFLDFKILFKTIPVVLFNSGRAA